MLVVPIWRDAQLWWDKPPIPSPRKSMPTETCFDDVGTICACVTWTQMRVNLQTKNAFLSQRHYSFFINLVFYFFPLLISIQKKFCKAFYTVYVFLQKIGRQDYHLFGAKHITLRGLRFVDLGIIYPILGKVLFQISFTNHSSYNVTSRVTTCKLAAQNVLSLNACTYRTGPGHCIRDISWSDCSTWSTLSADQYSFQRNSFSAWLICRVHVPPARSGQHEAVPCAVWHVNKPAPVATVETGSVNRSSAK